MRSGADSVTFYAYLAVLIHDRTNGGTSMLACRLLLVRRGSSCPGDSQLVHLGQAYCATATRSQLG